jgi:hypothetical protein
MKKRGLILIFALLFSIGLAGAIPPSFQVVNGYVYCGEEVVPETSYDIELTVYNDSNSYDYNQSVTDSVYSFVVSADSTYNISFYAGTELITEIHYTSYAITETNLTLDSSNSICYVAPVVPGGPSGGPSSSSDYCGDGTVQQPNDDGFTEQCDGSDLNDETCVSLGYVSGSLGCNDNCTFNASGCVFSGEGNGTGDQQGGNQDSNSDNETGGNENEEFPISPYGNIPLLILLVLGVAVLISILGMVYFKFIKKPKKKVSRGIRLK